MTDRIWTFIFTFMLATISVAETVHAGEAPTIKLQEIDDKHWQVTYRLTRPAQSLKLIRGSGGQRAKRWSIDPVVNNGEFEIVEDKKEKIDILRRRDGEKFKTVVIHTPTSYDLPPKDYMPFSRFGDGGLLIYTGRFHACAGVCPFDYTGDEGPWLFEVTPRPGERMIIKGDVKRKPTTFEDTGNGSKIYIGAGEIKKTGRLYTVIDETLPEPLQNDLYWLFPELMDEYAKRLGRPEDVPMMFVSYQTPGGFQGMSIKGGALPNQIFLHFEGTTVGDYVLSPASKPFLAWFFAHEAAHLHQHERDRVRDTSDSWIHEGGADALAFILLQKLAASPRQELMKTLQEKTDDCVKALKKGPLTTAADRGDFKAYYNCGFIAQLAAHQAIKKKRNGDLFTLWRRFSKGVYAGKPWSGDHFIEVVRELGDDRTASFITFLTTEDAVEEIEPNIRAVADKARKTYEN